MPAPEGAPGGRWRQGLLRGLIVSWHVFVAALWLEDHEFIV